MSGYTTFYWGENRDMVNSEAESAIKRAKALRLQVADSGLISLALIAIKDGNFWPIEAEPKSTLTQRITDEIAREGLQVRSRLGAWGYGRIIRAYS